MTVCCIVAVRVDDPLGHISMPFPVMLHVYSLVDVLAVDERDVKIALSKI